MRSFLLVSNLLVVLVSAGIFAATFFARGQIERSARSALLAQAQGVVTPWVDKTEAALGSPLAGKWLPAEQRLKIETEIAQYRAEPKAAIAAALSAAATSSTLTGTKERFGSLRAKLDKLDPWQERLRAWYDKALHRLLLDIRIFAGTNIIASLLAFGMAWASPKVDDPALLSGSLLLLFSLGLCAWYYFQSFALWTFVFGSSLEWWYPGAVALVFLRLCFSSTLQFVEDGAIDERERRMRSRKSKSPAVPH